MGIVSAPLALLLISGGIDLSVGSIIGLGGMTSASLLDSGTPVTVAVLAGILAGAAVGVANGGLSIFTKLSPIVVTLGALAAVRGLTFYISAVPIFGFPDSFTAILLGGVAFGGGRGRLSGVLVGVVFLGVLSNGLVLLDVRSFTQTLLKGIALVAAAGLATLVGRLETRAALAARSAASVGEQGR